MCHISTKRHAGIRRADLEAIMATGKIPLVDAEALSVAAAFKASAVDCLPIFLQPPSHAAFRGCVDAWLRETPRALRAYELAARRQAAAVAAAPFYDEVLVNTKLYQAVEGAVDVARKFRTDLFKDVSTGEDDPYAKEPWRAVRAVAISGHAALSRRDALLQRLLAVLPDKLAALPESTTRKAAKDEAEGRECYFGAKLADLQKAKDEGRALTWRQAGADVYCRTIDSAQALFSKTGKLAVVPLGDGEALAAAQAGLRPDVALLHVRYLACQTVLTCWLYAAPPLYLAEQRAASDLV
jgi:guanylate kinase